MDALPTELSRRGKIGASHLYFFHSTLTTKNNGKSGLIAILEGGPLRVTLQVIHPSKSLTDQ